MIINFNGMKEMTIPGMNNGTGQMTVRMYNDEKYRIISTVIPEASAYICKALATI